MASQPAYKTLAETIRQDILSGRYGPGQRLPTEADFVEQYGVSRQTVRHAFAKLVEDSLVYRVRGRGTFATPLPAKESYMRSSGSEDELLGFSPDMELEMLKPLERRTDVVAASRLNLPSDLVYSGMFRRVHGEDPYVVTEVYLPPDVGELLQGGDVVSTPGARMPETLVQLIERDTPIVIAGADQSITAVPAPADLAPHIECEPGDPVLRIDRIYFDQTGRRVDLSLIYGNPRRYSYRLQLRRSIR